MDAKQRPETKALKTISIQRGEMENTEVKHKKLRKAPARGYTGKKTKDIELLGTGRKEVDIEIARDLKISYIHYKKGDAELFYLQMLL